MKVQCPAKINLTLKVTGKRPDGFHNIESIMQTISLYDYLTIDVEKSEKFEINFEVANISNREIIEDDIVPEIEEIKTRDDKEIKKAIIEESIDLNDIKKKTKNNLWYVLLPIAFAIAFVLVLKKR